LFVFIYLWYCSGTKSTLITAIYLPFIPALEYTWR
jgi:hypothetical protein